MSDKEYRLVTSKTPIPTVDLVILRAGESGWEVLLMTRKTGYAAGGLCIIGGRQYLGEVVEEAIARQAADLGLEVEVIAPFDEGFPAFVDDNPHQDKTKHPVTRVYPVRVVGGQLRQEGEEFRNPFWCGVDHLPEGIAYDHRFEILKTVERMKIFKAEP